MKIALRIAGIVALLLLMAKPSIYMYWEPSVARSQFLLFKNVAMLFLATLWYLDATRKYFESSVVASTSVVFLPLIVLWNTVAEEAAATGPALPTGQLGAYLVREPCVQPPVGLQVRISPYRHRAC